MSFILLSNYPLKKVTIITCYVKLIVHFIEIIYLITKPPYHVGLMILDDFRTIIII